MPKIAKPKTAVEVRNLTKPGNHSVGGVSGLHLSVSTTGARSWILRTVVNGKRSDLGLGPFPEISLGDARTEASRIKALVRSGGDPLADKKAQREANTIANAPKMTFTKAAEAVHAVVGPAMKNDKYRAQWLSLVRRYCEPIADMDVGAIDTTHVMSVLQPAWLTRTDSMKKLRGQIEAILDWAKVSKFREGENPARWKGHLDNLLPAPNKVRKERHFEAMAYTARGSCRISDRQPP